MSPPNENVLIVPSRNVLLTGSVWRGGFRNISHDAARPRPAGRIEESKEGPDHATASRRGDWAKRAACSPAVGSPQGQRRLCVGSRSAKAAVQPQTGRENQRESLGESATSIAVSVRLWRRNTGPAGPSGQRPACSRSKDPGAGQRLP